MMRNPWNSLEIAKVVTSVLIPILLAFLGIYIHRLAKTFESRQWLNQKLIERRLAAYDELAPLLNDLLCYFTFVGCWKELDPPQVIQMKRDVDKKLYLAAPLFPSSLFKACQSFLNACYQTFTGWGEDAMLKTPSEHRQSFHSRDWQAEWVRHFCEEHTDQKLIQRLYQDVMHEFTKSFGNEDFTSEVKMSRVPANIK